MWRETRSGLLENSCDARWVNVLWLLAENNASVVTLKLKAGRKTLAKRSVDAKYLGEILLAGRDASTEGAHVHLQVCFTSLPVVSAKRMVAGIFGVVEKRPNTPEQECTRTAMKSFISEGTNPAFSQDEAKISALRKAERTSDGNYGVIQLQRIRGTQTQWELHGPEVIGIKTMPQGRIFVRSGTLPSSKLPRKSFAWLLLILVLVEVVGLLGLLLTLGVHA